ncbi:transposase, partial [Salmonella enterica subsp. enterica serovar Derby]|nr:transposase [Salmonella enterica subsp. enterica serovar Derby]
MLPFVRLQNPTVDLSLQQDNAPCHCFRIVSEWLDEHSSDVPSFPWPTRSPDLNPIEHIWDAIERDVRGSDPLHQIFVNRGSFFRGQGSVWLPNASGVLSSPCRDESPPSSGRKVVLHVTRQVSLIQLLFSVSGSSEKYTDLSMTELYVKV